MENEGMGRGGEGRRVRGGWRRRRGRGEKGWIRSGRREGEGEKEWERERGGRREKSKQKRRRGEVGLLFYDGEERQKEKGRRRRGREEEDPHTYYDLITDSHSPLYHSVPS